jgi:hypothetical protein
MVQTTLENIEEKLRKNIYLTRKNKIELLDLLAKLKPEVTELSKAKAEQAESIAGFIERSALEIMREEKNPALIKYAVNGLSASVKGFELSHPKLVEDVNYIVNALAFIGF